MSATAQSQPTIAGLTVERVISRAPGRYTLVEAVWPQGKRVALKLSAKAKDNEGQRASKRRSASIRR